MTLSAKSPKIHLLLIAAGMLTLSACATNAGSSDAETVKVATAASAEAGEETLVAELDPNEEVCKRVKQSTTRFTKKVCMTRQQWNEMAGNARRGTAQTQQRAFDPGRGN